MPTRFSVFNLPTFDPRTDGTWRDIFDRLRRSTILADELGFEAAWFAEHHFQSHGGILSAPDLLIAALAPVTEQIRFGLGVVQVPYHHPLSVVERVATLDQVTGGRLELGLGRAFLKCEYDGFGVPMTESRSRFNEGVEIIVTGLGGRPFSHAGTHYRFPELTVHPQPLQAPPVWVAAATTPETFSWAGAQGYHLMVAPLLSPDAAALVEKIGLYRQAWAAAGRPPEEAQVLVNVHVQVGASERTVRETADPSLVRYVAETRAAGASAIQSFMRDGVPADFALYPQLGMRWSTFSVDDALRRRTVVLGDVDACAEALSHIVAEYGATTVAGTFDFGQPEPVVQQSMRLFAEKVLPQVS
jgi:natural product biosynthesis luciferase-like monooxygenase protein